MENKKYRLKADRKIDRRTKVFKGDVVTVIWHNLDNDQMRVKHEKTGEIFSILKQDLIPII